MMTRADMIETTAEALYKASPWRFANSISTDVGWHWGEWHEITEQERESARELARVAAEIIESALT